MRVSDIIRQIADVIDSNEDQAEKEHEIAQAARAAEITSAVQSNQDLQAGQVAQLVQAAQNVKQASSEEHAGTCSQVTVPTDEESLSDAMVSPLQQEHELNKKSQGVDNHVASFAEEDTGTDEEELPVAQQYGANGEEYSNDFGPEEDLEEANSEEGDEQYQQYSDKMGSVEDDPNDFEDKDLAEAEYQQELSRMRLIAGVTENNSPTNYAAECKPVSLNPRANAALAANGKAHIAHTQRRRR